MAESLMQDIPAPLAHTSPVRIEHITSKPTNNSSVNITNMVKVLNFGVISTKLNADIG
jgi:hypothetical protein